MLCLTLTSVTRNYMTLGHLNKVMLFYIVGGKNGYQSILFREKEGYRSPHTTQQEETKEYDTDCQTSELIEK